MDEGSDTSTKCRSYLTVRAKRVVIRDWLGRLPVLASRTRIACVCSANRLHHSSSSRKSAVRTGMDRIYRCGGNVSSSASPLQLDAVHRISLVMLSATICHQLLCSLAKHDDIQNFARA